MCGSALVTAGLLAPAAPGRPDAVRPRPQPDGPRWRSPGELLVVGVFAALALVQIALAAMRLPAAPGETALADAAAAVLRGIDLPTAGAVGGSVARAQLVAYAAVTGAFDRYPTALLGAREAVVVACAVLLGAVVAVGWQVKARPVAVAAALGLLAAFGPAHLALTSSGPGLLGVTWLAVGAVLLLQPGPAPRLLGALAVAVGIATAPLLAWPVAVVVVVIAGRRWAPVAAVALALGSAAVVLVRLTPAPETAGALAGSDQWLVLVVAGTAVVAGLVLPALRLPAVAVASTVLVVVLPGPGAAAALPALVVAVLGLTAMLIDALGDRLARMPVPARRIGYAAMAAGGVALGVATAVGPISALVGPVGPAAAPAVARPDGSTDQRPVAVIDAAVPAPAAPEVRARAGAGTELARNPDLVTSPEVRASLRAGDVDVRALVVLAGLTGRGPVTVVALPAVPGEDASVPRHRVVLGAVDGSTLAWLRAQRAPYAPTITGRERLTLDWPVPAPPEVLGR